MVNTKKAKKEVSSSESCKDKNCPFHSNLSLRGMSFVGTVISTNMTKTAIVEWTRRYFLPKYERYEKRRTKVHAHNPSCVDAQVGDLVKIKQCRPLSKTKNFVIIEKIGKEKLFKEKLEAREEAKAKPVKTEEKKDEEKKETKEQKKVEKKGEQ
ncbi:30S ribosomal protein S17 [Candidatus Woesearchaeota archaeon]|nr:30S ribosomal protein S17 [Candidatus Woesearchaeota archaeon]